MNRLPLLLILLGCGGPGAAPAKVTPVPSPAPVIAAPPPRVATEPLDLTVRMRAERDHKKFGVAIDDVLRSGDFVELFVTVSAPAYVYVVQFFPDQTSAVLFPAKGDRLVQPGKEFRIPEGDEAFQLDAVAGTENIYVLATRDPVRSADASIADQIESIRTSDPAPPTPTPTPLPTPVAPDPAPPEPTPPVTAPVPKPQPKVTVKPAGLPRPDRMLTLSTRKLVTVKRPDGAPATKASIVKGDGSLLVVRFSFRHE